MLGRMQGGGSIVFVLVPTTRLTKCVPNDGSLDHPPPPLLAHYLVHGYGELTPLHTLPRWETVDEVRGGIHGWASKLPSLLRNFETLLQTLILSNFEHSLSHFANQKKTYIYSKRERDLMVTIMWWMHIWPISSLIPSFHATICPILSLVVAF